MKNSNTLKNELIFQYAAGTTSLAKSLMASTYLFLNSRETSIYNQFENYCGEELKNTSQIMPKKLTADDCMLKNVDNNISLKNSSENPISKFIIDLQKIKWKKIFGGFYEYSFNLSKTEKAKLIKMNPGAKVPLHSHNGKEFILVLEGSFSDEYGTYKKGNLQINDSKIKHTPIASDDIACICLTITEQDLIFFGPFAPILNILSLFRSFFSSSK